MQRQYLTQAIDLPDRSRDLVLQTTLGIPHPLYADQVEVAAYVAAVTVVPMPIPPTFWMRILPGAKFGLRWFVAFQSFHASTKLA